MHKSNYDLSRCFLSAGQSFVKNIIVVLFIVCFLPIPSFLLWMEAPLLLLCIELTLLDCFYLVAAVLLVYGMFGSVGGGITICSVVSPLFRPVALFKRCWEFFYSEPSGMWKSTLVMIMGIVFGLGVQWLAGPWKLPPEQNLIGACIYAVCLLFWSQSLVGWMLAPYYLSNLDLPANEAYKLSHFSDKGGRYWNLRLTAVGCIMVPVLVFGVVRYLLLTPADFADFQLNLSLTYVISIVPWMLAVYSLFVWYEIYRQRLGKESLETA